MQVILGEIIIPMGNMANVIPLWDCAKLIQSFCSIFSKSIDYPSVRRLLFILPAILQSLTDDWKVRVHLHRNPQLHLHFIVFNAVLYILRCIVSISLSVNRLNATTVFSSSAGPCFLRTCYYHAPMAWVLQLRGVCYSW